jgi:hypothetical protein
VKKASSTEDALAAIKAIRDSPEKFDWKSDLASFLRHKSNHVIAAAADTIERMEAVALGPELADAFLTLMKNPAVRDPGCKALIAIAKTLAAMDFPAPPVYFAGVRHVQKEGSYGPPVDAAAALRGLCAQGLARTSHPDALLECVTLLVDREVPARSGAVRALGETGKSEAMLLLRFKALVGDKDDEVMGECFGALLRLAPTQSLDFVAKFLESGDVVAERAALAIGESRVAGVFPLLRDAWAGTAEPVLRRTLLLAIALLRVDEGVEFLLERAAEEPENSAAGAIAALAIYGRDDVVTHRLREIVDRRKNSGLRTVFEREFHHGPTSSAL